MSVSLYTFASTSVKEISFGAYNNKEIVWEVIDETEDTLLLISKKPIGTMPFDINNLNYWKNSSLRDFLNNDFYNSFSDNEKSLILPTNTQILLSQCHKHLKENGSIPYYLTPFPDYQDMQIKDFYQTQSTDYVFLLNVFEYKKYIVDNDISTKRNMVFLTPYTNNSNMIRYIGNNGYIYINDSNLDYSIYPCITISKL